MNSSNNFLQRFSMHKVENFQNKRKKTKYTSDVSLINTDTGPFLGRNLKKFVEMPKDTETGIKYDLFNHVMDESE